MAQKQNKTSSSLNSLVQRQISKVKQSCSPLQNAKALSQLCWEYQFSVQRNESLTPQFLNIYCSSLLISNKFIELKCAALRNQKALGYKLAELYIKIANLANQKNLSQLISKVSELQSFAQNPLKQFLIPSAKYYILSSLSRDYININIKKLQSLYQINAEDVKKLGYKINDNFVQLPKAQPKIERLSQLMKSRVGQVSKITQTVIKSGIN